MGSLPVARVLQSTEIDLDRVLRAVGLDDVARVRVRPAPRWVRRLWIGPVQAMTIRRLILVDPAVLAGDARTLSRLLVHELVHVRQWLSLGMLRFGYRYLRDYLAARRRGSRHSDAYRAIELEREASEVARRLL